MKGLSISLLRQEDRTWWAVPWNHWACWGLWQLSRRVRRAEKEGLWSSVELWELFHVPSHRWASPPPWEDVKIRNCNFNLMNKEKLRKVIGFICLRQYTWHVTELGLKAQSSNYEGCIFSTLSPWLVSTEFFLKFKLLLNPWLKSMEINGEWVVCFIL